MSTSPEGERLQKVLARAGYGSRRACEELIAAGRVMVNGRRAELGMRALPADNIVVDGDLLPQATEDTVYYMLHKPVGVVSTASDPQGRTTVIELVPPTPRVFPVGRLDYDTSGLLLLTNDGTFANTVSHPSHRVPKTYVAEVKGKLTPGGLKRLHRGISLEDGSAKADHARVLGSYGGRHNIELTISEGRNRIVRRMFEALELEVVALSRTHVGPLQIGRLKPGAWRKLSPAEVAQVLGSVDS